jgi:branched-chain amino acid transport system substrate-binding protein
VDTYHKFGFPVIVWGAVLPDITYRNKYAEIHRVNGTMINQNDANAELISKLGYTTVAVIHDTTDYGKGHNEYFSKALAKLGKAKIVGTFGVTAEQQDFTAELTQIKSLNPQVIYFGGLTPIGVRIRQQMEKLGIKAVFDGTQVLSPTPTSRGSVRWPRGHWRSARARRPRSCRVASSSWRNIALRSTTTRRKPTVPLPSPR